MLEALRSIFEFVGKNYYNRKLSVELVDEADTAYAMGNRICLPVPLLEKFTQDKLPRFTVFYHELGHTLYSQSLSEFIERWQRLPNVASNYAYNDNYHHLLNWIEDFYIEQQLEKVFVFKKFECLYKYGCIRLDFSKQWQEFVQQKFSTNLTI